MTDEERAATIAALVKELTGYQRRGLKERAAQVQAQLDALTGDAKPPAKRATKRAKATKKKSTQL